MEGVRVIRKNEGQPSFFVQHFTCYTLTRGLKHRRFTWRYVWYYRRSAVSLSITTTWCFLMSTFVRSRTCSTATNCGFFANYRCGPGAISFYQGYILFVAIFSLIYVACCLTTAQFFSIFVHASAKDFSAIGWWSRVFGLISKFSPWIAALFHVLWICVCITLVIAIAFGTDRYTQPGLDQVFRCRWIHTRCCYDKPEACPSGMSFGQIRSCNDLAFLVAENYFSTGPLLSEECKALIGYNPEEPTLSSTIIASHSLLIEAVINPAAASDLYRYFTFTTILLCVVTTAITACLVVIKLTTPMESYLFVPKSDHEKFYYSLIRLLTPW